MHTFSTAQFFNIVVICKLLDLKNLSNIFVTAKIDSEIATFCVILSDWHKKGIYC